MFVLFEFQTFLSLALENNVDRQQSLFSAMSTGINKIPLDVIPLEKTMQKMINILFLNTIILSCFFVDKVQKSE